MWSILQRLSKLLGSSKASNTAIVLKGGLAKGFGEIAIIKYLQENNIQPGAIIGASSGAQIAAMWAAGMTWQQMLEATSTFHMSRTISYYELLSEGHLFGRQKIRDFFLSYNHNADSLLETMSKRIGFLSHSLTTKKLELLAEGSLVDCLIASNAHPGVIAKQHLPTGEYIDGDVYDGVYLVDEIKQKFNVKYVIGLAKEVEPSTSISGKLLDFIRPDKLAEQCDESKLNLLLTYDAHSVGYTEFSNIPNLVDAVYELLLENEKELRKYI